MKVVGLILIIPGTILVLRSQDGFNMTSILGGVALFAGLILSGLA